MAAASNTAQMSAPTKADPYSDRRSLEFGFRARRFEKVQRLIEDVLARQERCEILDLGGTETYWLIGEEFVRRHRSRLAITIVNTEEEKADDRELFTHVLGSATDQSLFAGRTFDLVHSNSVVEHVGAWPDMVDFASNVRRLAPRYYVQTPNYWFPYEPHFRFPGFQFLPEWARRKMIMHFSLGFFQRISDPELARELIHHHRLISRRQMAELFPDAEVTFEKVMGLNKSIIAIRG